VQRYDYFLKTQNIYALFL